MLEYRKFCRSKPQLVDLEPEMATVDQFMSQVNIVIPSEEHPQCQEGHFF